MKATDHRLSIKQAYELVGVSRRTIYNWMKAGKLDVVRTAGGSLRILPASLYATAPIVPSEPDTEKSP